MARSSELTIVPRPVVVAAVLVSVGAVFALLYWAQAILIPFALASLLTFMLTPVVEQLERWRIPRIPAVVLVVIFLATLVSGIGWTVGSQFSKLAADLPAYQENIKEKMTDIREFFRGGTLEAVQETIDEVNEELEVEGSRSATDASTPKREIPVPVQIQPAQGFVARTTSLSPVVDGIATAGLIFILLVFMLIKREDLLNRLISLAGIRRVAKTTKALHEAGERISRYLLAQFILNGSYGIVLGLSLWLIGVPYAPLWGFFAALFRYVPYIGPLAAAVLPIAVSILHFPGWTTALIVVGIFIVLELISNNVLEPLLYGSSVGLSEVAVIVSAVFWTMLWGPMGLVLATPMTVCLVVLGKHIPALSTFDRLLSHEPALKPHIWLYQRLLGRHERDVEQIVHEQIENTSLEATCDEMLLPLLGLTKKEWLADQIDDEDQTDILQIMRDVIASLPNEEATEATEALEEPLVTKELPLVIGFPVREHDELALQLLAARAPTNSYRVENLSANMLIAERLAMISDRSCACVCISSLPPGDLGQTRQLCKLLRAKHPELKIVVGRWGEGQVPESVRENLQSVGATRVVTTITKMLDLIGPMVQSHNTIHPADQPQVEQV